jgi:hypothetical protein
MKTSNAFTFRSLRSFAHQHDDLPAFHAAYLVLTFLAAALFNLGFFALLIVCHLMLDVYKYRDVHHLNWKKTLEGMFRESLLDITLLCMGVTVAVYLHPSLPLYAGIQGLMLAEVTLLRAVGVVTPKLKILYDFLKILAHVDLYLSKKHVRLGKNVSALELVSLFSLCVSAGLLIAAPVLLSVDAAQYLSIILDEMIPWTH